MNYLLDTCAISETIKYDFSNSFREWFSEQLPQNIFLSSVTIGELVKGIDKLEESVKKRTLIKWLSSIEDEYQDTILPFNKDVAKTWGTMMAFLEKTGKRSPIQDSMIGATALHHNMILVTRNVKDFVNMPIEVISPWE